MKHTLRVLRSPRIPVAAVAAWALAVVASRPLAAEEATLELFHGPNESEGLVLKGVRAELDGKELPVQVPAADADPAVPIYKGTIAPGVHDLQVEVDYAGGPSVFSYVEGYHFRMRGQLEVKAAAGDVVGVQSRVHSRTGMTVKWQDRYYLSLSGAPRRATEQVDVAGAAPATVPAPSVPPPPKPTPPPAVAQAPAEPPVCVLDTVHFGYAKANLDSTAVAALDRYAACLAGNTAGVILEGYCDQRGPAEYNQRLGERRALAAAKHLQSRGVAEARISVRSLGKSHPVCTEATEACYAQNRRVEAAGR